jgi:hypothetical protein
MDETLNEPPVGGLHTETQQSVPRIEVESIDPQLVRRVSILCLTGLELVLIWLPQSHLPKETLLDIMLSLKTEMTRLEEWTALLGRTNKIASTIDNEDPVLDQAESFNVVLREVSVTLLLLAAQLEALVQKEKVKQGNAPLCCRKWLQLIDYSMGLITADGRLRSYQLDIHTGGSVLKVIREPRDTWSRTALHRHDACE